MKNDTTFVRMHNGGHFENAKMSKNNPSLRQINFLTNRHRQNGFRRMTGEG